MLGTTLLTTPYGFTYIKRRSSTSQRTCVIPCERAAQSWSDRMACSSFCKGYRLPLTTSCNHTILQILRYSNDCNQAYQLQETCETEGWLRPYSQLAEQNKQAHLLTSSHETYLNQNKGCETNIQSDFLMSQNWQGIELTCLLAWSARYQVCVYTITIQKAS